MSGARQAWLAAHPYLEPIARFQGIVEDAASLAVPTTAAAPPWEAWAGDAAEGVPLLRSAAAGPGLAAASAEALGGLVERLAGAPLPGAVAEARRAVGESFRRDPAERLRAIAWIVRGSPAEGAPAHAGVLRHLAWTAARSVLARAGGEAARWCEEGRWGRGECPACGSLPALAQLVQERDSRPRFLACALCGTRWRHRRIGCPFCGTEDQDRLHLLDVEGHEALRLDTCDECHAYLKTYTEEGDEDLFLADWPTLHLDLLARGRGLRRLGASLYELPEDERRTEPWPTEC